MNRNWSEEELERYFIIQELEKNMRCLKSNGTIRGSGNEGRLRVNEVFEGCA